MTTKKNFKIFILLIFSLVSVRMDEIPSEYSSQKEGFITSVKDQGNSNICWAFASISSSEASIIKNQVGGSVTNTTISLSPYALAYRRHHRTVDPLGNVVAEETGQNYLQQSGDPGYSATVLSLWNGPVDFSAKHDVDPFKNSLYRLENAVYIDAGKLSIEERIIQLKKAILEYGAVTFSYNNRYDTIQYYNPSKVGGEYYGHACTLVGWEDNIQGSRFSPAAGMNGGWIVKNSYLSLPYFYMSFESTTSTYSWTFDYAPIEKYDYNYYYDSSNEDLGGIFNVKVNYGANIYEAKKGDEKDEYVKAVNVGIQGNKVTAEVFVYTDVTDLSNPESGDLEGQAKEYFEYGGYRTIELEKQVFVEKGTYFAIVVKLSNANNDGFIRICKSVSNGMTKRKNGNSWESITYVKYALRIKAYTKLEEKGNRPSSVQRISGAKLASPLETYKYTGQEIKPEVSLTLDGNTLVKGQDYTVTYEKNIEVGTATIKFNGINKFKGTKTETFIITAKKITEDDCVATYGDSSKLAYNGQNQNIEVSITCGSKTLEQNNDYTVRYENTMYPSANAKVTIVGINNYSDLLTKTYSIQQRDINLGCQTILDNKELVYNGSPLRTEVSLRCGGLNLYQNTDYDVTYSDNVKPGTAKIQIHGKRYFKGESTIIFMINKAEEPSLPQGEQVTASKEAKNLKDIKLPEGWEWKEPELELTSDLSKAEAVYTGEDKDCYKKTTTNFSINYSTKSEAENGSTSTGTKKDNPTIKNNNNSHYRKLSAILTTLAVIVLL